MVRGGRHNRAAQGGPRRAKEPPVHATSKASLQPMYRPLSQRVLGLVVGIGSRASVALAQRAGGGHG
jgi:hypothetical protein